MKEVLDRLDAIGKTIETDTGALKARMDQLEERQTAQATAVLERKGPGSRVIRNIDDISRRSLRLDMTPSDVRKFSISRFVRAIMLARSDDDVKRRAPFEWDVHNETRKANEEEMNRRAQDEPGTQQRTMTTLLDTTGGYVIPEMVSSTFYPVLYANMVTDKMGVTQMGGLTSFPLRVNKQTSSTTAYRHGETVAPTASDIALGQINLMPHKCSVFTKISEEDVKFTSPAIDQLVAADQMMKLALKMDIDFFEGSGASSTPLGIVNQSGISQVIFGSGTPAILEWDDLLEMEGALEDGNALIDDGSLAFVMKPIVKRKMYTKAASAFTYGPNATRAMIDGKWRSTLGTDWPIYTTTQLSTDVGAGSNGDYIFFARWSDTIHATWGGLELKKSNIASDGTDHGFTQDLWFLKVSAWDDVAVIRPASVAYTDDAKDA